MQLFLNSYKDQETQEESQLSPHYQKSSLIRSSMSSQDYEESKNNLESILNPDESSSFIHEPDKLVNDLQFLYEKNKKRYKLA